MVEVRAAASQREVDAFLRLPWQVYEGDRNWVAPLWRDYVATFDPSRNAELAGRDYQPFVAWCGETAVGTIVAHIDRQHDATFGARTAWFGQLELVEDAPAEPLLAAAERWARARDAELLMGPATFGTASWGLLIDGFHSPPAVLMPYARPYYQKQVEAYPGLTKSLDVWAWHLRCDQLTDSNPGMRRLRRAADTVERRKGFTVRTLRRSRFWHDVEQLRSIYNAAFAQIPGYVPLDAAYTRQVGRGLRAIVDPSLALFIESAGRPIGFAVSLPDANLALHRIDSRPHQWHWLQLARVGGELRRHRPRALRVWALAVLPEFRNSGADVLLYAHTIAAALRRGYREAEISGVWEDNTMMNRPIARLGGRRYKTYRVYRKLLSAG